MLSYVSFCRPCFFDNLDRQQVDQLLENRPFFCTSPRTKSFSLPILRLEIVILKTAIAEIESLN